jgi:hypothetical protein
MATLRPDGGALVRKGKQEVHYRNFQACRNCDHFYKSGMCELVEGPISAEGMCNLWEPMEKAPVYRDKEYFQQQYDKVRNG